MTPLPWATRIAAHLADSRRHSLPFEQAWAQALAAIPPKRHGDDGWNPATLKFAEAKFRLGYNRKHALGTTFSLEGRLFTDPPATPIACAVERRCGWGGGCNSESREGGWLCPVHSERLQTVTTAPRTKWGRLPVGPRTSECVTPGCKRTAKGLRCEKHSEKVAA